MSTWGNLAIKYTSGERISSPIALSSIGVALTSTISWNETLPVNTTLDIQIALSTDGGQNYGAWQNASNGGAIPGITTGLDVSNAYIKVKEIFATTDTSTTSQLHDLTLNITTAYKTSGTLTSVELNMAVADMLFTTNTPVGTSITVEYSESSGSVWADWKPVTNGRSIGGKSKIKYRVNFSTTDLSTTPVFSEITLTPHNYYAVSPSEDVSLAADPNSGKINYEATFNGTSNATIKTRTSDDDSSWSQWDTVDVAGDILSNYGSYVQILILPTGDTGDNNPTFDNLTLSYDGTPEASELATGLTAGSQFYFATLLSKLAIFNKLDAPRKWDGANPVDILGGSPPHCQYVATHKNFLFAAHTISNPSRLYYSEVLDLESWPALNYIDISPDDGDWITGLLPFGDYLIVTKQRSIWLLLGSQSSDFEVRRIHDGIGCIAPRSLIKVNELFGFVSTEGFYVSNLSKPILLTERLKNTWRSLNSRRLTQAAAAFYDHKIRIDVPDGSSTVNNFRIIYDTIRKSLNTQELGDHASCYAQFVEAGQEVLLYGHSTDGQVSIDIGTTDAGEPITMVWDTKHFNFGSSAVEKKVRRTYLVVVKASSNVTLNVYYIVDNVMLPTPITKVIAGSENEEEATIELNPRDIDVRKVRTLGYRITQSTTNGGVKIHELLQEYRSRKVKET